MSQLVSQLSPAMRAFFDAFFHGNTETPNLEALRARVGTDLEITVGRYRPYSGPPSNIGGHLYLPSCAIHVEREQVYFSGTGRGLIFFQRSDTAPSANAPPAQGGQSRPQQPGQPAQPGQPPPAPAPPRPQLPPYQYSLVRVDERVDPITDERDEMVRLFAGLDAAASNPSTGGGGAPPAGGGASTTPGLAQRWADAIVAARRQNEAFFATGLESLTAVLPGLPTTDLAEYKRLMYRLATYLPDGRGTYYPKRNQSVMGANGLPIGFPEGTTIEYRRINARELSLTNGTYCLVNVPEGWGGVDRQVGQFREIVFRLQSAEGGGVELVPVSWATRIITYGDAPARDFYDFCFFIVDEMSRPMSIPDQPPLDELPPETG